MEKFEVQNLKCGGCGNTIKKGVLSVSGVKSVDVDVEESIVSFECDGDEKVKDVVKEKLSELGYPVVGDKNTIGKKAKSFVSCAVGRMSSEKE